MLVTFFISFEGPCFLDVGLAVPRDCQFDNNSIVVMYDEEIQSG